MFAHAASRVNIRLSDSTRMFFLALISMLACALTDAKIFDIKIGELIGLSLLPWVFFQKSSRVEIKLFAVFLFFTLSGLFVSLTLNFYPMGSFGLLKQPFYITIVRFLELISCFSLVVFITRQLKNRTQIADYLKFFLVLNALMGVFFIGSYPIGSKLGLYYGELYRLQGFFVEGGPLGLYFAFLVMLVFTQNLHNTLKFILCVTFASVIFLAQSKAGFVAVLCFVVIKLISHHKKKSAKLLMTLLLLPTFLFVFSIITNNYIQDIKDAEVKIQTRAEDYNFAAGRISGVFISSNMILAHPIIGIGLGNYPILRNNPDYRGFFPEVPVWDSASLGGVHSILLESGIIGLFLLFILIRGQHQQLNGSIALKTAFWLPFMFGVQIYFHYPWIAFALIQSMIKHKQTNSYDEN